MENKKKRRRTTGVGPTQYINEGLLEALAARAENKARNKKTTNDYPRFNLGFFLPTLVGRRFRHRD